MKRFGTSIVTTLLALSVVGLAACSTPNSQQKDQTSKEEATDKETKQQAADREGAKQVTVLFLSDLHAQLEQHPELFWSGGEDRIEKAAGFARMARAIDKVKDRSEGEVLVVDGGDTIQGSGAAALTEGGAVVPAINAMDIDAGIPGNWSVAYGTEMLRKRLGEQFDHEMFAANVHDEESGDRLFDPYIIREMGGVKVAVIGYTDPDIPTRQPPSYSEGLSFTGPDQLPGLIEEVRQEKGADIVLLQSHIGLSKALALTDDLPEFDAHLSGDTHERTHEPINRDGTWVVEPGAFGSFLGKLDFWVKDGEVVDREWELIEVTAEKFDRDPEVLEKVQNAKEPLEEKLDKKIGHTDSKLIRYNVIETSLDNLLADALRDATGTDIALSNGFRFGHPVMPGPLTQGDLWRFYPIVTNIKTAEVTGQQLIDFWESELNNVFAENPADRFGGWVPRPSGMSVTFEAMAPKGERVREVRVHGEKIDPDETYTITACEREGEPKSTICRIPNAKNAEVHKLDAHEAVRKYLSKHDSVESELEGRVDAVDLPSVVRTQIRSQMP
jgi:2',3'-cyclic-nucleotide 2'-phosphodiesterase (5'-nucleotidase family)